MAAADKIGVTSPTAVFSPEVACATTLKVIALIATLAIGAGLLMHFMRWTNFTAAVVTGSTGVALLALSLLGCYYPRQEVSTSSSSATTAQAPVVSAPTSQPSPPAAAAVNVPPKARSPEHEALYQYFKGIVEQGITWKEDPAQAAAAGKAFLALRGESEYPEVLSDINTALLFPMSQLDDADSLAKREAVFAHLKAFLDGNRHVPASPRTAGDKAISLFKEQVRDIFPSYRCENGQRIFLFVLTLMSGTPIGFESVVKDLKSLATFKRVDREETTLRDIMLRLKDMPADQFARRAAIKISLDRLLLRVDIQLGTKIEAHGTTINESFKRDMKALRTFIEEFSLFSIPLGGPVYPPNITLIRLIETAFHMPLKPEQMQEATGELNALKREAFEDLTLSVITHGLERFPKTPENQHQRREVAARLTAIFSTVQSDPSRQAFERKLKEVTAAIQEFQR